MTKRHATMDDVTLSELMNSFHLDTGFNELLERLPLYDFLLMPDKKQNFKEWQNQTKLC